MFDLIRPLGDPGVRVLAVGGLVVGGVRDGVWSGVDGGVKIIEVSLIVGRVKILRIDGGVTVVLEVEFPVS